MTRRKHKSIGTHASLHHMDRPQESAELVLNSFFDKHVARKDPPILEHSSVMQKIQREALVWMNKNPRSINGGPLKTQDGLPDNRVNTYKMPIIEWNAVSEHLRQRLGEQRPKDAILKFEEFKSDHRRVKMCIVPHFYKNGDFAFFEEFKADGGTRARAWREEFIGRVKREMPKPDYVYVDVEFCWTLQDAHELYTIQDSSDSVKKSVDDIGGASGTLNLDLQSHFMQKHKWKSGLEFIHIHVYGTSGNKKSNWTDVMTALWAGEIFVLDRLNPGTRAVHVLRPAIFGMCLALLRRYQNSGKIRDFVKRLVHSTGKMSTEDQDAVAAAIYTITDCSVNKKLSTSYELSTAGFILNCVDKHMQDKYFSLHRVVRPYGVKELYVFFEEVKDCLRLDLDEMKEEENSYRDRTGTD